MLMAMVPCPAYWEEKRKTTVSPEVKAVLENDPELVDALEKNARIGRNVHDIEMFHQTLRAEVRSVGKEKESTYFVNLHCVAYVYTYTTLIMHDRTFII